ncbi:MAG: hypothetical protein IBJ07_12525 [Rhizobiaceae bacterium]|nr:hypothetical protein [Rhizobiaceae bacterium]
MLDGDRLLRGDEAATVNFDESRGERIDPDPQDIACRGYEPQLIIEIRIVARHDFGCNDFAVIPLADGGDDFGQRQDVVAALREGRNRSAKNEDQCDERSLQFPKVHGVTFYPAGLNRS